MTKDEASVIGQKVRQVNCRSKKLKGKIVGWSWSAFAVKYKGDPKIYPYGWIDLPVFEVR